MNSTIWKYYAHNFLREFFFFSAVLIPFYTQWGHISLFQVQLLQSWFMLWVFFLELPTGAIADYFGRKYSLALGAFIVTLGALLYGSIPRFEIFLLGEFIFAVGMALTSGADQALLFDSLKEAGNDKDFKAIYGKSFSFSLLGIMLAAPIGSFIASRYGLNAPMLFSAIPFLLSCIVALSIKEPQRYEKTSEKTRYVELLKGGLKFLYAHKTLRVFVLDIIAVNVAGYFVIWLYQPLLQTLNIPILYFGLGHFLLTGIEILIMNNVRRLEYLFCGPKNLLRYTALLIAFIYILTAFMPNIVTISLFIVIAGGFGMTRFETMSIYMNHLIPSEKRATVLSSVSMFRRFALVLLNPLIGFAASHSLQLALILITLFPLAIFLISPLEKDMFESINTK